MYLWNASFLNMTHVTKPGPVSLCRERCPGFFLGFIIDVQQFPPLVASDDKHNAHVSGFGLYPVRDICSIFNSTCIMGFYHFSLLIVTNDNDNDTCSNSELVLGG